MRTPEGLLPWASGQSSTGGSAGSGAPPCVLAFCTLASPAPLPALSSWGPDPACSLVQSRAALVPWEVPRVQGALCQTLGQRPDLCLYGSSWPGLCGDVPALTAGGASPEPKALRMSCRWLLPHCLWGGPLRPLSSPSVRIVEVTRCENVLCPTQSVCS